MTESNARLEKKYKSRKKSAALGILTFLLIVLLTVLASLASYRYVIDNQVQNRKSEGIVIEPENGIPIEIPLGSNTAKIASILEENSIIKYPLIFKIMSKLNGYDGMYQSGTHIVSLDLDYDKLMIVLTGKPVSVSVTIPEGYNFSQAAGVLVKKGLIDRDKFLKTANNEKFDFKFLEGLLLREQKLEGYLFPDTYEFDIKAGEKEIIRRMLENFNSKFKPEYYTRAKELNMTVDQVIILASIIEREAKLSAERKVISGVFHNRLKSKDPSLKRLQSCATIQYIFYNKEGIIKEKISEKDTKVADPYNTYENAGLPPGPICSPGSESIEAALYPDKTEYMFFVAKGDGSHQFSKTLSEHQAAVKKYGLN